MKHLLGGISIFLFSLGTVAAETISILGSDTLLILNQEWTGQNWQTHRLKTPKKSRVVTVVAGEGEEFVA